MPNSWERELMIELLILRNGLYRCVDKSKDRLRKLPHGYRDARLMATLVDKLQDGLLKTMPEKYFQQYLDIAKKGHLKIELPGPARTATYAIVDNEDLARLIETVINHECTLCVKLGSEAKQCPIREALIGMAPPEKIGLDASGACEYADYASRWLHGEEVIL